MELEAVEKKDFTCACFNSPDKHIRFKTIKQTEEASMMAIYKAIQGLSRQLEEMSHINVFEL